MRLLVVGVATMVALGLCGCSERHPASTAHHGRYLGVGIYSPKEQWTKMIGADTPNTTPAARTIDDQAIIVVEDSDTGEIRACGDLTGYCVGTNPWKKALTSSQTAPINLTVHVMPPKPSLGNDTK